MYLPPKCYRGYATHYVPGPIFRSGHELKIVCEKESIVAETKEPVTYSEYSIKWRTFVIETKESLTFS